MEEQKQKEKDKEPIKEASEEISRRFKTLLDSRDLDSLKQTQHLITRAQKKDKFEFLMAIFVFGFGIRLGRLQDSNAVLSHFNEYSENCYAEVSVDLAKNTRVLKSMKADLDYIFQKLRSMKSRMLANYPDAFPGDSKGVLDRRPDLELP
ncbi:hypothetical protein TIFTF001_023763 [Ficus carica]|uniref:KxDL domain-containing protein n=1 Tax=Ficus carica TaxID=3494 RepID=A0AA88DE50_FICCA|nr:hypothetical protein TIFTF001_023763 [Ficus carica]